MSRLSVYETPWIDLVFENRNKDYGAYQLRRDSVKTSLAAFFMALLFIAFIVVATTVVNYLNPVITTEENPIQEWSEPIKVTEVVLNDIPRVVLPEVKNPITETKITKEQLINPEIVHPEDAVKEITTNVENKNTYIAPKTGSGTVGSNTTSGTGTTTEIPKAVDYGTSIVNSSLLDKLPDFPGGMKNFYTYVDNNFENPDIEGMSSLKVHVSFVIEKDGSMSNIKVLKDTGYGLGQEAIRVLKSLKTKWTPGIIDSKPVRTSYNLPISIELR
jgi:protein TonB